MGTLRMALGMGAVCATLGLTACGQVDQVACQDVQRLERAVSQSGARGDVRQEILDDLGEIGYESNCPGYEGRGDSE